MGTHTSTSRKSVFEMLTARGWIETLGFTRCGRTLYHRYDIRNARLPDVQTADGLITKGKVIKVKVESVVNIHKDVPKDDFYNAVSQGLIETNTPIWYRAYHHPVHSKNPRNEQLAKMLLQKTSFRDGIVTPKHKLHPLHNIQPPTKQTLKELRNKFSPKYAEGTGWTI